MLHHSVAFFSGGKETYRITIANLVLQDTVERIYAGNSYAEEHVGLYLVRGENVLLLGEIVSHSSQRRRNNFFPCG